MVTVLSPKRVRKLLVEALIITVLENLAVQPRTNVGYITKHMNTCLLPDLRLGVPWPGQPGGEGRTLSGLS